MKYSLTQQNRGFTVIEMIVVIFIFSIVMTIAMGAIFTVISSNKVAQKTQSVMDNLNAALDSMSRNTRFGTNFAVSDDGLSFSFTPYYGDEVGRYDQITYFFDATNAGLFRQTVPDTRIIPVTAPEVIIEDARFYFGNSSQPRVFLVIKGFAQVGTIKETFNIQTLISQRVLNIPNQ